MTPRPLTPPHAAARRHPRNRCISYLAFGFVAIILYSAAKMMFVNDFSTSRAIVKDASPAPHNSGGTGRGRVHSTAGKTDKKAGDTEGDHNEQPAHGVHATPAPVQHPPAVEDQPRSAAPSAPTGTKGESAGEKSVNAIYDSATLKTGKEAHGHSAAGTDKSKADGKHELEATNHPYHQRVSAESANFLFGDMSAIRTWISPPSSNSNADQIAATAVNLKQVKVGRVGIEWLSASGSNGVSALSPRMAPKASSSAHQRSENHDIKKGAPKTLPKTTSSSMLVTFADREIVFADQLSENHPGISQVAGDVEQQLKSNARVVAKKSRTGVKRQFSEATISVRLPALNRLRDRILAEDKAKSPEKSNRADANDHSHQHHDNENGQSGRRSSSDSDSAPFCGSGALRQLGVRFDARPMELSISDTEPAIAFLLSAWRVDSIENTASTREDYEPGASKDKRPAFPQKQWTHSAVRFNARAVSDENVAGGVVAPLSVLKTADTDPKENSITAKAEKGEDAHGQMLHWVVTFPAGAVATGTHYDIDVVATWVGEAFLGQKWALPNRNDDPSFVEKRRKCLALSLTGARCGRFGVTVFTGEVQTYTNVSPAEKKKEEIKQKAVSVNAVVAAAGGGMMVGLGGDGVGGIGHAAAAAIVEKKTDEKKQEASEEQKEKENDHVKKTPEKENVNPADSGRRLQQDVSERLPPRARLAHAQAEFHSALAQSAAALAKEEALRKRPACRGNAAEGPGFWRQMTDTEIIRDVYAFVNTTVMAKAALTALVPTIHRSGANGVENVAGADDNEGGLPSAELSLGQAHTRSVRSYKQQLTTITGQLERLLSEGKMGLLADPVGLNTFATSSQRSTARYATALPTLVKTVAASELRRLKLPVPEFLSKMPSLALPMKPSSDSPTDVKATAVASNASALLADVRKAAWKWEPATCSWSEYSTFPVIHHCLGRRKYFRIALFGDSLLVEQFYALHRTFAPLAPIRDMKVQKVRHMEFTFDIPDVESVSSTDFARVLNPTTPLPTDTKSKKVNPHTASEHEATGRHGVLASGEKVMRSTIGQSTSIRVAKRTVTVRFLRSYTTSGGHSIIAAPELIAKQLDAFRPDLALGNLAVLHWQQNMRSVQHWKENVGRFFTAFQRTATWRDAADLAASQKLQAHQKTENMKTGANDKHSIEKRDAKQQVSIGGADEKRKRFFFLGPMAIQMGRTQGLEPQRTFAFAEAAEVALSNSGNKNSAGHPARHRKGAGDGDGDEHVDVTAQSEKDSFKFEVLRPYELTTARRESSFDGQHWACYHRLGGAAHAVSQLFLNRACDDG